MFSPLQEKILKILGRKSMTIVDITTAVYSRKKKHFSANNGVGNAIRRINEKCNYHKLAWFLNGFGAGRSGRTVWKDKR